MDRIVGILNNRVAVAVVVFVVGYGLFRRFVH